MWAAYYQFDGEVRHTVAIKKFKGHAELEAEQFISRMTHPEVGVWWVWVEEVANESPTDID